MSKKWTYELDVNSDVWSGSICDSREEAIKEATEEAAFWNIKKFKIGVCEPVPNYGIDVDDALERIKDMVYDDVGEIAEDYFDDVTEEQKEELQEKLDEVFYTWQKKYNHKPNYYTIESEEIIEVKKESKNNGSIDFNS